MEEKQSDSSNKFSNNFKYSGYQHDSETGLYYLNSRMYDPSIARFLQEDTYAGNPNDPLSLNLYTYCSNEPVMYWDPTGHWKIVVKDGKTYAIAEKGDTLSGLARIQLGDASRWKELGYSGDPKKLQIGQSIDITRFTKNNQEDSDSKTHHGQDNIKNSSNVLNSEIEKPVTYGIYKIGEPVQPEWKEGKQYDEDFKYNPETKATFSDYKNWAEWGIKAYVAGALSSDGLYDLLDASVAYLHYRSGEGTDLHINYQKAYEEDEYIRATVDKYVADAQIAAQELYKLSGQNAFTMTGELVPIGRDGYPVTENWRKTIGAHYIWISADVSVDSDGKVTIVATVHEIDRYNFNKGMEDIDTGTKDEINGQFAVLGWAKSFNTIGEMVVSVTSYIDNIEKSTSME